ncbi:ABC-2 family transporter protein [Nocardiopsis sp. HNM0947]|uniref:ABC-2 family transporter protein n=1 Tax=Nocardiopsis coralli TaxID=2772213 RepID=A0ABR9P305_9ACTN|nr:ABC-2 family transporter protein [Nocardiopsis coralli]MBE2998204.1 ABC-2 family transporter protein [Nocardiopsis coralli]
MLVHGAVYARGLRRYSTYRAATLAGVLTNSVFGAINAMVLLALFGARPEINGYDATDAVTQVFIGQALIGVTLIISGPSLDLSTRIRTGDVAMDLLRPVPLQSWWLAQDLGRATFAFAWRGLPTFAVGALLFDLAAPDAPLATVVSLLLVAVLGFALRYLYTLSGFWILDVRGLWTLMGFVGPVAAGMMLPLALFPAPVADVLRLLPWASLVQIPAEIYLGKDTLPGGSALGGLALQAGWATVLLGLGAWVTGRATRKVVVQGG